jgi:SAM-dependent methyltransferase
LTASAEEAERAAPHCERVLVCDVEGALPSELSQEFDAILCCHVLEHLRDPIEALLRLAGRLTPEGVIAIAVPNMAHWRLRVRMLRGDWTRDDTGAFDRTHLHFWSFDSIGAAVRDAGFEILIHRGDYSLPQRPLRSHLPALAARIDQVVGAKVPNFAAGQTLILARATRKS